MDILDKLAKSKFRAKFKLRAKELEYIKDKGLDKIRSSLGLLALHNLSLHF